MGKDNELLNAVKSVDVSAVRKLLVKFKSGPKGRKALSKKLHINIPDEDGFTALHHASLHDNVEIVLALIEMEADPNARDKKVAGAWQMEDGRGLPPATLRHITVIWKPGIIDANGLQYWLGMCPLHMAAWSGKDQIVKTLLENRSLVNLPSFSGETPLLLASQHGYANVVEILMKFNADPTIRNNNLESPIDVACQFGHTAVIRLLLMRGEVVHMLHEKQTDPRFKIPLHLAAKGGHVEVARLLIESGADVNQQTSQGTCLHLAALYGKVEVLKLLIEAGANVRAVNQKNMTPLDMVNQFTTSRAGIEIKQLLREATGEHVVFGRAVSDHINVYDSTCLQFKAGDTITILEQNEDGRWKGSVVDGKVEKIGYFPATAVSIISNKKETASIGSISSSSDSSLNSAASGKEPNQAMKSPSRMAESHKPVGVVPVGTYEVLTLAPTHSPDTKKPPARLNSFKKDTKSAANQRRRLNVNDDVIHDGNSSNRSSSADTSMDSGIHSQSTVTDTTYDIVPGTGKGAPAEVNVYDPLPPPVAKSPRIFPTNPPAKNANFEQSEHRAKPGDGGAIHNDKYADISIRRNDYPQVESPSRQPIPAYADVYVAENRGEMSPRFHSEARTIPQAANKKSVFRESYENMHWNEELMSKIANASEKNKSISQGYRDTGYEDDNEPFPSPPPLPVKSPSVMTEQKDIPPSPPKKIESRAINYRRNESYENVTPRQIVPVHVQNPFNAGIGGQQNLPSQPPQNNAASFANYENFTASSMPNRHTSAYENYRPQMTEPQLIRSATVAEKPRPPAVKAVPLPPKMLRKGIPEPTSPASPVSMDPVKTPYLSQLNLETLTEDENELLSWLIELKLPQYFQNFQLQGYDMVSVRGVSPEDLTAIEITKAGHRKKVLSEVTKLGPSSKLPTHKPDNVGSWLKLLGLQDYENNFIEGGFDEMDFIKDLDLSDLEMIEIRKKGHQKKLLLAVQKLSDVELTAELDDFVSDKIKSPNVGTKVVDEQKHERQPEQKIETPPQQNGSQDDVLSPPPTAKSQVQHTTASAAPFAFPPPPPSSELENTFMLNRDNLPPPSGKESTTSHSLEQKQPRVAPGVPLRAGSEKPRQVANQHPIRARTGSSPVAPKPKPKPRPTQNMGQVRTASEYRATESPSKSVIMPTPVTPQKPNVIAEETETVSASKSRDFWLQSQQQQPQNENAPVRTKSVSGIKPVVSPRPSNDAMSPRQDKSIVQNESHPAAQNEARRASVKKAPPPAPPRRDSMSKKKDSNQTVQDTAETSGIERSRTFSGPLDEKIRQVFRENAHKGSMHPAPIEEQPQEDEPPSVPVTANSNIEEELQATDSIMADIDHMIADFTSQLDSMFD